jgi:serine/threonine protein kinase
MWKSAAMDRSWSATDTPATTQATMPATRVRPRSRPEEPLVLDRYRLQRRLGSGGFGTVWLARDQRLDRDVAVKVLPRDRVAGGRFEREARAAARLSHPGIVTLYEAAVDDEGAYLVSELVRGSTLDRLLDEGMLSDRDIVRIGIALCDALAHAHAQAVVHRDVKPSNVLVPATPATPEQVAKLTDFGVARVVGGDTLTRTGDVLGTAAYMAPEQALGREAGAAADLYSLGLVLYEALTGVNPIQELSAGRGARRLAVHLPPVRRYRRELPRELARSIDLALRPRARERGSVAELRDGLWRSLALVPDEPGVVEAPWRPHWPDEPEEQWAAPREWPEPRDHEPDPRQVWPEQHRDRVDEPEPGSRPIAPPRRNLPQRALAALGTGVIVAWIASHLAAGGALTPVGAGAVAAAAVGLAPRLGWIASVILGCAALALDGRGGAAMVLAPAGLLPVVLLPHRPRYWPLAVAAPALGILGLAGAWPALAARASGRWQRVALGGIGWTWLLVTGALAGVGLYTGLPHEVPASALWTASGHEAARHVIVPLLASGLTAPALVWGFGALALPVFTATRSPRARIMLAGAWSLVVVLATVTVLALGHAASGVAFAPAALGGLTAALLATLPFKLR